MLTIFKLLKDYKNATKFIKSHEGYIKTAKSLAEKCGAFISELKEYKDRVEEIIGDVKGTIDKLKEIK